MAVRKQKVKISRDAIVDIEFNYPVEAFDSSNNSLYSRAKTIRMKDDTARMLLTQLREALDCG